jgi:hypothetical protein
MVAAIIGPVDEDENPTKRRQTGGRYSSSRVTCRSGKDAERERGRAFGGLKLGGSVARLMPWFDARELL